MPDNKISKFSPKENFAFTKETQLENLSPKLAKLLIWKKMSNKGKTLSKKML